MAIGQSAVYRSSDLDETRSIVAGIYCDHRLDQLRSRACLKYEHTHCAMGGFSFSRMRYGADVSVDVDTLGDFYLIQVPLSGTDRMCVNGHSFCSDSRYASVNAPMSGLGMNWSADCLKFAVRIERKLLEGHAAALSARPDDGPLVFMPSVDLRLAAPRSWVATAQHVLNELQRNPQLATQPLVRTQFEQLLMTTLLSWMPGSFGEAVQTERRVVLPRHVKVAEEFMRANPEQVMTIETLASVVGVSGRTLFDGFRKFLGVSPMRYLRDLRMECARRDLLDASRPRSVTTIATHWGFYQLGRFACDYRRRFDEHPHETMAKGR
ncbi:AraC family transcriptional regulator [Parazoarcus communis]|uniref:AraC family transcriptional regulator n=1 Tax=Parazoarcus communis TaxID=41977 RepID=A0A2U8H5K1_9RHOO|nr:AraC family transcriptional regulator [Parazoarcus communis]